MLIRIKYYLHTHTSCKGGDVCVLSAMAENLSIWFRKQLIYENNNQTEDLNKNVLSTTKQLQILGFYHLKKIRIILL